MSSDLERRYRRVLRLLPGWYRKQWEQDMVAAFLDGWLTGDPEADEYISKAAGPGWAETASVAGLAVRLHLGAAAIPRRHLAWGQAARNAVLAVMLVHAVRGVAALTFLAWSHRWVGWIPGPSASTVDAGPPGTWTVGGYVIDYAWIVAFLTLVLRYYRTAQVIAALIMVFDLVWLLQHEANGMLPLPFGQWAYWVLLDLALVLAMTTFQRDAPPVARRPWLLALPAIYLLVWVPLLALQVTGNTQWLPDFSGLCCILVALACLAHIPGIRSRPGSGLWSLTLALLAAVAAADRLVSLNDYLHDPHLINVSLAELLILAVAAALVAPDAARAHTATPAPPAYPQAMAV
jgi:hypothetical protein